MDEYDTFLDTYEDFKFGQTSHSSSTTTTTTTNTPTPTGLDNFKLWWLSTHLMKG